MSTDLKVPQTESQQPQCPYCQAVDNELFSLFGQTLIGSQYYCRQCHTVFEAVRWEEPEQRVGSDGI